MLVCVEEINSVAKGEAFVTVERAVEWNELKIFNFPSFFIVEKKKKLSSSSLAALLCSLCVTYQFAHASSICPLSHNLNDELSQEREKAEQNMWEFLCWGNLKLLILLRCPCLSLSENARAEWAKTKFPPSPIISSFLGHIEDVRCGESWDSLSSLPLQESFLSFLLSKFLKVFTTFRSHTHIRQFEFHCRRIPCLIHNCPQNLSSISSFLQTLTHTRELKYFNAFSFFQVMKFYLFTAETLKIPLSELSLSLVPGTM